MSQIATNSNTFMSGLVSDTCHTSESRSRTAAFSPENQIIPTERSLWSGATARSSRSVLVHRGPRGVTAADLHRPVLGLDVTTTIEHTFDRLTGWLAPRFRPPSWMRRRRWRSAPWRPGCPAAHWPAAPGSMYGGAG